MPCGDVSYKITISSSSNKKQEVVNVTTHNFSKLKSASTYRVTVAAVDRRITGPKTNHTVQLPISECKISSLNVSPIIPCSCKILIHSYNNLLLHLYC